tara:strand:+ start:337 stop:990 length:654 start_codon:yes stop_codon:yes gene_type:complete
MAEPTNYKVFLELQRRNGTGTGHVNRIALNALSVQIATNRTIPNIAVPLAGAVTGEGVNLAFDLGMANKTISVSGILLEQQVQKLKTSDGTVISSTFTPFELAQLIHSYVDSSSFQFDQNINKIIILIPSKVGNDFTTRPQVDIPFTFKNREFDNDFTAFTQSPVPAFETVNTNLDYQGVTGFVRSFSTTFAGEQPNSVEFQLEFEQATLVTDNFFD